VLQSNQRRNGTQNVRGDVHTFVYNIIDVDQNSRGIAPEVVSVERRRKKRRKKERSRGERENPKNENSTKFPEEAARAVEVERRIETRVKLVNEKHLKKWIHFYVVCFIFSE